MSSIASAAWEAGEKRVTDRNTGKNYWSEVGGNIAKGDIYQQATVASKMGGEFFADTYLPFALTGKTNAELESDQLDAILKQKGAGGFKIVRQAILAGKIDQAYRLADKYGISREIVRRSVASSQRLVADAIAEEKASTVAAPRGVVTGTGRWDSSRTIPSEPTQAVTGPPAGWRPGGRSFKEQAGMSTVTDAKTLAIERSYQAAAARSDAASMAETRSVKAAYQAAEEKRNAESMAETQRILNGGVSTAKSTSAAPPSPVWEANHKKMIEDADKQIAESAKIRANYTPTKFGWKTELAYQNKQNESSVPPSGDWRNEMEKLKVERAKEAKAITDAAIARPIIGQTPADVVKENSGIPTLEQQKKQQSNPVGEAMAMADDLIEQQRLGMAAGGVIGLGRGGRMRGSSSFGPSGFGSWGGVRGGRMSGSSSFRSWGNDGGPVTGKATMFLGNRAYNANPWSYEVPTGWPAPQQRSMGGIVGMSGGGLAGVGEFPDSFRLSGATNVNVTAKTKGSFDKFLELVIESGQGNHVLDHQRSGSVYA
jgi:hypothetical protein